MLKILITGATGNVGLAVVSNLISNGNCHVIAGVRNIAKAKSQFQLAENIRFVAFDFEDETTHQAALKDIDIVFLLRPPHISDVERFFRPLIKRIVAEGITKIVFLSVQGVETSSIIPHHKIEKLIVESGLDYIFVRPSYFMQNLSTTFLNEIRTKRTVTIPAKNGFFNWIDVENIGEATARLIMNFDGYEGKGYDLTGNENKTFTEVCKELSRVIEPEISFISPSILSFFRLKRKEGMAKGFIIVMILLHILPRFQKPPKISDNYKMLCGKEPNSLVNFFEREMELFL